MTKAESVVIIDHVNTRLKIKGTRAFFAVLMTVVLVALAGCGANNTNRSAGQKVDVPILPTCSSDQLSDTKATANAYARDLIESQDLHTGWDGKTKLIDVPASVEAASKAAMLPCIPDINISNTGDNPQNVQTIQKVIPQDLWAKLILSNKVGAGNQSGAPKVEGFDNPADSYKTFLSEAARFPYFCGEKGKWDSVEQACQRELSTFFAHAIQETGEKPVPAGEQVWQTALYQTFEGACYPAKCDAYDGGKELFDAPADESYYGRGIKQLSWAYNYAAFSASYYGNMQVLIDHPNLVGMSAPLVLGSGIWFAMQPQPTKPSMHDVVTGIFEPHDMPASGTFLGVTQQADGSILQKFASTVSIINGAYECSPSTDTGIQQSKNRFINYKALLPQFGVPESAQTANEKAMDPGKTYCEIAKGNPWSEPNPQNTSVIPLGWQTPFYLNTGTPGKKDGTCWAVGYGQAVPLPISAAGMLQQCTERFQGSATPTDSPSPTGTASPTAAPTPDTKSEVSTKSANGELEVTVVRNGAGWATGYCAAVKASSLKNTAIDAWSLQFDVTGSQIASDDGSGPTVTKQPDGSYVFKPADWAKKVAAGATDVSAGTFCVEGGTELPTKLVAKIS